MKKTISKKAQQKKQPEKVEAVIAEEIKFYRANEKPYGALSNLYRRGVTFENEVFATSEHAYQAGKARKKAVRDWILSAPTPGLVAMAAHGLYTWDINSDWSKVKFDRMRQVLRAKFSQHEDLRELLLSTGQARLVEAGTVDSPVNRVWGEVNGKGQNMLGVILMEVREELRKPVRSKKSRSGKGPKSVPARRRVKTA
ncbi:NADAR family protein [Hydrocarboniphaga sp.]|uniref:NADAR family protein n=1 Tax=Hydrocarboniphaga sp. TaxID=2033016 RepID=UPI0026151AC1|nr:NADAR family protein [Hydrocarboniphaga sp.]